MTSALRSGIAASSSTALITAVVGPSPSSSSGSAVTCAVTASSSAAGAASSTTARVAAGSTPSPTWVGRWRPGTFLGWSTTTSSSSSSGKSATDGARCRNVSESPAPRARCSSRIGRDSRSKSPSISIEASGAVGRSEVSRTSSSPARSATWLPSSRASSITMLGTSSTSTRLILPVLTSISPPRAYSSGGSGCTLRRFGTGAGTFRGAVRSSSGACSIVITGPESMSSIGSGGLIDGARFDGAGATTGSVSSPTSDVGWMRLWRAALTCAVTPFTRGAGAWDSTGATGATTGAAPGCSKRCPSGVTWP